MTFDDYRVQLRTPPQPELSEKISSGLRTSRQPTTSVAKKGKGKNDELSDIRDEEQLTMSRKVSQGKMEERP